jgi:vanillate O-demethylase ferredoxin subunit
MRLRVIEKQFVATETVRIRLARHGDSRIGPFQPGAHIEIEFAGYTRRYSLTSDPQDLSYLEICVLRNPLSRGGSAYLHDSLKVGDTVLVVSLANDFNLVPDAGYSLLIAGGIGITPTVSMITALHRLHSSFELHYVASQASRFLPLPPWAFSIANYYSGRKGTRPLDVDRLCGRLGPEAQVYVCGPPELIRAVRFAAGRSGRGSNVVVVCVVSASRRWSAATRSIETSSQTISGVVRCVPVFLGRPVPSWHWTFDTHAR